jgi:hypothetical protein
MRLQLGTLELSRCSRFRFEIRPRKPAHRQTLSTLDYLRNVAGRKGISFYIHTIFGYSTNYKRNNYVLIDSRGPSEQNVSFRRTHPEHLPLSDRRHVTRWQSFVLWACLLQIRIAKTTFRITQRGCPLLTLKSLPCCYVACAIRLR